MKAITVEPGRAGSARVDEVDEPAPADGELLVEGIVLGICGTDRELHAGEYGWAPPGRTRLIIGHESLGRVLSAPEGSGFETGDTVVGVVRRPDPEPCGACAHGHFDMCRNGGYRERGIKELDGYGSQRWVVDPAFAVRVDPELGHAGVLLEPTSVVAKAWDQIERIGGRSWFSPSTVVVTGAGPIGLLAAQIGRQRGLEVHVVDRVETGRKPELVAAIGARYHSDIFAALANVEPDILIETTGADAVIEAVLRRSHPYSITCLLGMNASGSRREVDLGRFGNDLVLSNGVVFGSVNANVEHWRAAADVLARADTAWLRSLITRTLPLTSAGDLLEADPDGIKTVIDLQR